eukprot:8948601-Alexandrium_andersonii.AAC.1
MHTHNDVQEALRPPPCTDGSNGACTPDRRSTTAMPLDVSTWGKGQNQMPLHQATRWTFSNVPSAMEQECPGEDGRPMVAVTAMWYKQQ